MNLNKRIYFKDHTCELDYKKRGKLVRTGGSKWIKVYTKIQLLRALWVNHYKIRLYFRSAAAIEYERKRHLQSKYYYIIHPFSKIHFISGVLNIIAWIISFFHDPWFAAYNWGSRNYLNKLEHFVFFINVYLICNCFLNFFTGYVDTKTGEVIIDQKVIIKRYIRTFFIFDILGSLPYLQLAKLFAITNGRVIGLSLWLHLLRCARIKTLVRYLKDWCQSFDMNSLYYYIVMFAFIVTFEIHVFVCLLYYVPKHVGKLLGYKESWIDYFIALKKPSKKIESYEIYLDTLHIIIMNFFRCGNEESYFKNTLEYVLLIIIIFIGTITNIIILSFYMTRIGASSISESKYSQLIAQIKAYSLTNKLSLDIQKHLGQYYAAIYHGKYFETDSIIATLSNSIRQELLIQECRNMLKHIKLFEGVPKDILEHIIPKLNREYFLTNDVLYSYEHHIDCLYFISYGTVAIIYSSGNEWCHYSDGDTIGEMPYLNRGKSITAAIATELCEILLIDVRDFDDICSKYPLLKEKVINSAWSKRRRVTYHYIENETTTEEYIQQVVASIETKRLREKYIDKR